MRLREVIVALCSLLLLSGSGSSPSCPEDMVRVGERPVCIDAYPWPNIHGERPMLGLSGIPEIGESGYDAEGLCASVGKRVCNIKEWQSACEGPSGARYPWGDSVPDFIPGEGAGLCNYDQWFRPYDAKLVYEREPGHMAYLDQSEPAGSRPECVSAVGAWDMIGVEQWVRCHEGHYGWCLVGRFWADPQSCTHKITRHSPKWHWYTTTARCCLDLEAK